MAKIAWLTKLPKAFLGGIIGLVFGGWAGGLFGNIGFVPDLYWEEGIMFLGALFGAIIGWNEE
jgi:hypothetical protein